MEHGLGTVKTKYLDRRNPHFGRKGIVSVLYEDGRGPKGNTNLRTIEALV